VKEETRPKISLHLWYTGTADEAAAFLLDRPKHSTYVLLS